MASLCYTCHQQLRQFQLECNDCCADLAYECPEAKHTAAAPFIHTPGTCVLLCGTSGTYQAAANY